MSKQTVISIIIVLLVIAGGVLFATSGSPEQSPEERNADVSSNRGAVPSLELVRSDGESVNLASFVGKPLVINSWATWCPFCVDEIPDFALLQEEFGDAIVVIAVNRRESVSKSEEFLASVRISPSDMTFLYDSGDTFYRGIGGFTMPETLFVNAEGTVLVHKRGFMGLEEMREHTHTIIDG